MGVFIKIPEGLNEDKYFYSKDNENDIEIYKVGSYESGKKRHIYVISVTTVEEARDLCEKLNEEKISEEEFLDFIEQ
ncbi:MAG: hypothetical protein AABW90_03930 [Nanoarchaeota archaeon]